MMYKIGVNFAGRLRKSRRGGPTARLADSHHFLPQFRVRVEGANAAGSNESSRRGQHCRASALKKQRTSRDANILRIRTLRVNGSCAPRFGMGTSAHPRQR